MPRRNNRVRRFAFAQTLEPRCLLAADLGDGAAIIQPLNTENSGLDQAIDLLANEQAGDVIEGASGGDQILANNEPEPPLSRAEQALLARGDRDKLSELRTAEREAQAANRQLEKAQQELAAANEELNRPENLPQQEQLEAELDQIQQRIAQLEAELARLADLEQNSNAARDSHVVPVGVADNGDIIWGHPDNSQHLWELFQARRAAERELESLRQQQPEIQEQLDGVRERVEELEGKRDAAQEKVDEAQAQADAANEKLNETRKCARERAEEIAEERAEAEAARELRRRELAIRRAEADFNRRIPYITRAIEALQQLGVADENVKPGDVVRDAKSQWMEAMQPDFAGTIVGVAADAVTPTPGGGTAISVTQIVAGMIGIRQGQLTPSHEKGHLDKVNGIVPQRLPALGSDPQQWLIDNHFALNRGQAEKVLREMNELLDVDPVSVRL